ncbi:21289_t:CDS:2, partial [Gigaspora margarita]
EDTQCSTNDSTSITVNDFEVTNSICRRHLPGGPVIAKFQDSRDKTLTYKKQEQQLLDHGKRKSAENHQEKHEVNDFYEDNSMAPDVEEFNTYEKSDVFYPLKKQNHEPTQEAEEEKTKNPYINKMQESNTQEATTVEQNVHLGKSTNPSELAKAQLSLYNKKVETSTNTKPFADLLMVSNRKYCSSKP